MNKINVPQIRGESVRDVISYTSSTFHGGEKYVKIDPEKIKGNEAEILFRFQGDASIIELLEITDALRRLKVTTIDLLCPYFPGARADRIEPEQLGEALSVKVYASIINGQKYRRVILFDPHSNVTPALLDNVEVRENLPFIRNVVNRLRRSHEGIDLLLISPDQGASKKCKKVASALQLPMLQADKSRDLKTGELLRGKCSLHTEGLSIEGKSALIVDDICSKGGTFVALAKALKEAQVKEVFLAVSHYENVADISFLREQGIEAIYTTNSLGTQSTQHLFVDPIELYVS